MVDQEYGFPGIPEYPPAGHEFVPPKVTDNTGKKKRKLFGFNKDTLLMSLLAATVSVSMLTGSGVNAQEEPEAPVSVVIDSMVDLSEPVQTGDNTVADISDKVAVDVIPVSDDHRDADLEFQVLCFVPECVHADEHSDTSADQGECKKGCLRDAKGVFTRPSLIISH